MGLSNQSQSNYWDGADRLSNQSHSNCWEACILTNQIIVLLELHDSRHGADSHRPTVPVHGGHSRLHFLPVHTQSPHTRWRGRVAERDGDLSGTLRNSSIDGSPSRDVGRVEGAKDVNVGALVFLDDVEKVGMSY